MAIKHEVDQACLPEFIVRDVQEFCTENHREFPKTQEEVLDYYLIWNGIVGYTSRIRSVVLHAMAADVAYLTTTDQSRADWLREVAQVPSEVTL